MNRICTSALLVIGILVTPKPVFGAVAETTLCELTAIADSIVVAKTEEIIQVEGISVARVTVQQVIKGDVGRELYFLAESTWTCDISGAEVGETALLFLSRYKYHSSESESPGVPQPNIGVYKEPPRFKAAVRRSTGSSTLMQIAWAGRGQMPLRKVEDEDFVTIWTSEVQLPTEVESVDGPEAEYAEFIRSVPLDHILFLVQRYLKTCGHSR